MACALPGGLAGVPSPPNFAVSPTPTVLPSLSQERASPDSAAVRGEAEGAQRRFERIRRGLLPQTWGGGRKDCDERVGRFCFWHDQEKDEWMLPPDSPDLATARNDLLEALSSAANRLPGDDWILGQRIRYLTEGGAWEDAARLARICGGAHPSWCSVLEGFALHGTGRYEAALECFHDGLETMDSREARRWRDPSMLLDGRGSSLLEDAAEVDAQREADSHSEANSQPGANSGAADQWENLRARVWTLADPLYLVEGNDRESEHYARWVFSKMHEDAQNPYGIRWGDDLEELTVRYGWDRGWERVRQDLRTAGGRPTVIGHQTPGGKRFAPPGRILEVPSDATPGVWLLEGPSPRSSFVPAYAPTMLPGVAQLAVFHRGDSILVAVATELPSDPDAGPSGSTKWTATGDDVPNGGPSAWPRPSLLAGPQRNGLFLVDEGGRVRRTSGNPREGAFHLSVPAGRYLLSVEAWAPDDGIGGRVRHGITTEVIPDDLVTLSDLILLRPGDGLPQTLRSALPMMRSSTRLKRNDEIVLGWEVFGLGWRQEVVSFELSFYEQGESFFGRIGRWFGLGSNEEPLRIEWSEPAPPQIGPWFRSVDITIPRVDPGEYVFRLTVTTPGRGAVVMAREVEITP